MLNSQTTSWRKRKKKLSTKKIMRMKLTIYARYSFEDIQVNANQVQRIRSSWESDKLQYSFSSHIFFPCTFFSPLLLSILFSLFFCAKKTNGGMKRISNIYFVCQLFESGFEGFPSACLSTALLNFTNLIKKIELYGLVWFSPSIG